MNRKLLIVLNAIALVIIASAGIYYFSSQQAPHEEVHKHAGFLIYVDGAKQEFSDFKYMSFKPCGEDDDHTKLSAAEEQKEKAHLHDGVGNVVHVHRAGATWGDLFKNVPIEYDTSKQFRAYRDAQPIDDILSQEIRDKDSIIILIGDQSKANELLDSKVSLDEIAKVEQSSELCGTD